MLTLAVEYLGRKSRTTADTFRLLSFLSTYAFSSDDKDSFLSKHTSATKVKRLTYRARQDVGRISV